jgi:hypothetical protein
MKDFEHDHHEFFDKNLNEEYKNLDSVWFFFFPFFFGHIFIFIFILLRC